MDHARDLPEVERAARQAALDLEAAGLGATGRRRKKKATSARQAPISASFTSAQARALLSVLELGSFEQTPWRLSRLHVEVVRGTLRMCVYRPGTFAAIWLGFDEALRQQLLTVTLPPADLAWGGLKRLAEQHWPETSRTLWRVEVDVDRKVPTVSLLRDDEMTAFWVYDARLLDESLSNYARRDARRIASARHRLDRASECDYPVARVLVKAAAELGVDDLASRLWTQKVDFTGSAAIVEFSVHDVAVERTPANARAIGAGLPTGATLLQGWTLDEDLVAYAR